MAVGLFWNDRVSFEKHEWAKRFFFLGNNTGNLVFIRADLPKGLRPSGLPFSRLSW